MRTLSLLLKILSGNKLNDDGNTEPEKDITNSTYRPNYSKCGYNISFQSVAIISVFVIHVYINTLIFNETLTNDHTIFWNSWVLNLITLTVPFYTV